jgi:V-type H+-transporting ATPase subunit C
LCAFLCLDPRMSAGQEFWIVAAGPPAKPAGPPAKGSDNWKERYSQILGVSASKFEIPDGLPFGSFDSLVRLTDDLQKSDNQVDSIVHRLERQFLEIEPKAQFKVLSHPHRQGQEKDLKKYLETWQWDEAMYPKSRPIHDNLTHLMSKVSTIDENARTKTAQYNEFKSQKGNLTKKDAANLLTAELIDVLTPDVVQMNGSDDDFIYTQYLSTVAVIVPRGMQKDFLKIYETLTPTVVPRSAKCFGQDKDGNQIWRVVVCKEFEKPEAKQDQSDTAEGEGKKHEKTNHVENFKRALRERRYVPRDFEYSAEGHKKLEEQRKDVDKSVKDQYNLVKSLYSAAWSDAMVAWVHIKAMRVFVESVLRFGMPPCFASFIITPDPRAAQKTRKRLADVLGTGQSGFGIDAKKDDAQDEEEYFPYVSLTLVPFTASKN